MHKHIKIDEVLKVVNLQITNEEFQKLKGELFEEIKKNFLEVCYIPEVNLSISSVSIGKLMMLANELDGVKGVLKLANEYSMLLTDALLEINDKLRLELYKK